MKRNISLTFLLLFSIVFSSFSQGFTGDSWAQAKQSKNANVVVTYSETPLFAEMANGQTSGLCFDIMSDFIKYVKSTYGITLHVEYKKIQDPKSFDLFLDVIKMSNGGVFGLGDVTITEKRKEIYNFSPAYFSNVAILITSKSSPTLSSISNIASDFSGMKAVSQRGSTHDKRIRKIQSQFSSLSIEYVDNSDQKLSMVSASPEYFTYVDFPNYLNIMNKRMALKRHVAGDDQGEEFGFVMPKNCDWAPILSEFFNSSGGYVNSDRYRKILSDNLGANVLKLLDSIASN